MVIKIMKKYGFSLAEVLISMLILSVFFLATSKVMTTKQNPEVQENLHGYYECFIKNGSLTQKQIIGTVETPEQTVTECSFTPPPGLAYVIIYAIRDSEHIYKSVEPQFNSPIARISSEEELRNFYTQIENLDPEESDLSLEAIKNYIGISYPSSGLLEQLDTNHPALFLVW